MPATAGGSTPRARQTRPISFAKATLTACQQLSANLTVSATANGTSNSGAPIAAYRPARPPLVGDLPRPAHRERNLEQRRLDARVHAAQPARDARLALADHDLGRGE